MDPDPIFCGGNPLFHSQQHIRRHVQEYGHAERSAGFIYQHALSSMGHQTPLESVRGHHQVQEMVDHHHAGHNVCSHADAPFPASSGYGRSYRQHASLLCDAGALLGNCLCLCNP